MDLSRVATAGPAPEPPTNETAEHALSFGRAAAEYDRWRAGYPRKAVSWAMEPRTGQHERVIDLGAGTGILSRALVDLGFDVIPVEPNSSMRDQLVRRSPQLHPLEGTAEDIPLPDNSVGAVVAGQSYHWFDHGRANQEIARVLKPGGVVAALWNSRDASEPWVAALNALTRDGSGYVAIEDDAPRLGSFGAAFGAFEGRRFAHGTSQTPESLFGLVSTTSYYLAATPQRQRELEAQVYELSATHCQLAGRGAFDMPHRTTVYRATLRTDLEPGGGRP